MRSEKMIERAHTQFSPDRNNVARFRAPVLVLCASLALASCSSFSGYVSDHWPMWAGGMPNDVPPRPGAPGYEEFISHQQAKDEAAAASAAAAAAAKQGATPAVGTAPAGAAPPRPLTDNTGNLPAMPPGVQRVNDQSAAQGGLY
jgi:hypothetical protein